MKIGVIGTAEMVYIFKTPQIERACMAANNQIECPVYIFWNANRSNKITSGSMGDEPQYGVRANGIFLPHKPIDNLVKRAVSPYTNHRISAFFENMSSQSGSVLRAVRNI
jgi:hypothetical protein